MKRLFAAAGILVLCAGSVGAQATTPPPQQINAAQMAAMAVNARKMQFPAEFVLEYKQDLNLRPDQIAAIEKLVLAQRDSTAARMEHMRTSTRADPSMTALSARALVEWTGPIDEQAMRDVACQQSKNTAELMIGMARDRHAVGEILTEAQRTQLPMIEMKMMSQALKKP